MISKQFLKENPGVRLKDLATVKTNFADADFWVQRKGSSDTVGSVSKDFTPSSIGVKVERTDVLDPQYLYYMLMNMYHQGQFKPMAKGTLQLQHITRDDIANIRFG